LDSLSIRQKLFLVFGVLIAIFIANGAYTGYSLNSINSGALRIATEHLSTVLIGEESSRTLSDYRQGEYAVVTAVTLPSRIQAAQETKKRADQLDIAFDSLEPAVAPEVKEDFAQMRQAWDSYKQNSNRLILLAKNNQQQEALKLLERSNSQFANISNRLARVVDSSKDFIHKESADASAKYEATKWMLIGCIVVVVLLSAFMAFYLSSSIMRSIRYLIEISEQVAAGNLTVKAEAQTDDELGQLTQAYGNTIHNLRSLIQHIQQTADDVSNFAEQLTENANQSAQATQLVANSITNVAGNTSQQGEAVDRSLSDIKNMTESLHGFEDKADASASAARSVSQLASAGKTSIDGAVSQMSEISASVNDSARVIQKLAERSSEIGQISTTISGIAEQTNLLSLNAAIEAARAGDAGRGFAVVAEEVRKLAKDSDTAAQQIALIIEETQKDTAQAVERMTKGTQDVESGRKVIAEAGRSFDSIVDAVSSLTDHADAILTEARDSSAKAEALVEVMDSINKSGRDVAAETESVSAATEEQSASMDEVAHASQKLADLSRELTDSTKKFKI
jgi:methyl-accepting chemotaxis protein